MPPRAARGGRIAAAGEGSSPLVRLQIRVEGIDKTTDEFKRIRRDINVAMRDAMERIGQRIVVPAIKSGLPRKDPSVTKGLDAGAMAASITIKRDRLDVMIRSTLPKKLDRALGWIDFGGRRRTSRYTDSKVRVGPHVIIGTLNAKSNAIDDAVYHELEHQFRNFQVS